MKNKSVFCAFCVIMAGVLWGMMGIFVRYFEKIGLDSMTIVGIRVTVTAAILGIVLLIYSPKLFCIKFKDCWCFIGTGMVSIVMFSFCYFTTMTFTSLSVAAVLLYTEPIMVMLMAAVLFKEKLTAKSGFAALLAFMGCFFVAGIIGEAQSVPPKALLTGLLSALGYGLYSIFGRYALNKGYHPLTIAFYTFVFAAVGSVFLIDPQQYAMISTFNGKDIVVAVLMGIVVTVLPYVFYTIGLSGTESGSAAIMASVEPVVATIVSLLIFREGITIWGVIGIMLVLSSIVILNTKTKKRV